MNANPLLTAVLLLGCMAPLPGGVAPRPDAADLLPSATRDLVVPGSEAEDPTLLALLREFSDCTGQELLMDDTTRQALSGQVVPLLAGTTMPAGEVYPFVESVLFHHAVSISPLKGGEVPLLGVYSPHGGGRGGGRFQMTYTMVEDDLLPLMEDHPALLVETSLYLPHTEVRQLTTSMRQAMPDQATQMMIPTGDHGIVMRTTGRQAARIARMLYKLDEATARNTPPVEEPAGPHAPRRVQR